ncbi:MAG: variant-type mycofactocin precursor [Thermodesulfobacteriota bacterium]
MEEEVRNQEHIVTEVEEACPEQPAILEEITVEEMAVDGICGIY